METKVGEYIRTERGYIGKIKRIEFDNIDKGLKWYVFDYKEPKMNITKEIYINKPYIKKHSFNIKELIEVGDYLNGYRVYKTTNNFIYCVGKAIQNKFNINIKEILTHEQYKRNCYRLEE